MGNYSKIYTKDQKQIKFHLRGYHSLWLRYNRILKQTQYGLFDMVITASLNLIEDVKKKKIGFNKSNLRVKKIFLQKWQKKYGKINSRPYDLLEEDIMEIVTAIRIRKEYLRREGLKKQ